MADNNNPPKFSFTNTNSGASPFGGAANTTGTGSGSFSKSSGGGESLFGKTTSTGSGLNLFGHPTSTSGNNSGTSTPGGLFGGQQTSALSIGGTPATSTFSGASVLSGAAAKKSSEPGANPFSFAQSGSSTPRPSKPGSFGNAGTAGGFNTSTTPIGDPKQTMFSGQNAASTGSGAMSSIFGGGGNQAESSSTRDTSELFPIKPASSSGALGLFNTSSAPSSDAGVGLFGTLNTSSAPEPSPLTSTPSLNLGLGGNNAAPTSTASATGSTPATAPVFGATNISSSTAQPATTTAAPSSFFSKVTTSTVQPTTTAASAFSNMFASASTSSTPAAAARQTTSSAPASGTAAPSLGGNLLNPRTTTSAATLGTAAPASNFFTLPPPQTTASAPRPVFGASNGNAPASTTTSAPSTLDPVSSLFNPAPRTTSSAPAAGTAAPSSFGVLNAASSTANNATNAPAAGIGSGGGGGSGGRGPGATGSNAAPASGAGAAPTSGSRLAHKSLDEILTMWSTSLTQHQKTFQNLAQRASAWDRQLVENSTKISTLYGRCFQAERDCSEVERQLTNVEHTQYDIEHFLDKYEEEVDKMLQNSGVGEEGIGGVDAERERTYKTAENCAGRLGDLQNSLTDMVEEINFTSSKLTNGNKGKDDDPLRAIVSILNGHLVQLQKIGNGAHDLQNKVAVAQRETRGLQNSQGLNGGRQWVEDFGASYLGRR